MLGGRPLVLEIPSRTPVRQAVLRVQVDRTQGNEREQPEQRRRGARDRLIRPLALSAPGWNSASSLGPVSTPNSGEASSTKPGRISVISPSAASVRAWAVYCSRSTEASRWAMAACQVTTPLAASGGCGTVTTSAIRRWRRRNPAAPRAALLPRTGAGEGRGICTRTPSVCPSAPRRFSW